MKFSQRVGRTPVRTVFQTDSMDTALRNRLWNVLYAAVLAPHVYMLALSDTPLRVLFATLWDTIFQRPIDTIPETPSDAINKLREMFYSANWFEVYDILEHVLQMHVVVPHLYPREIVQDLNQVLEQEMAGYRIVDGIFTPITSDSEMEAITHAIADTQDKKLAGANTHLKSALQKISDRKNPDYRNSIKESISAVESIARLVGESNKATLGDALKVVEAKIELHKALKSAFSSLYGYTSDEQGIRHALLDAPTVDFEDAKFMLITCSAFISFLLGKCARAGIML
jgi:hypothetical protein